MIKKIFPVILMLVGLSAGAGAGLLLRPTPDHDPEAASQNQEPPTLASLPEYAKLSNQFIVPVVEGGRIAAMVIVSLSLEVTQGTTADVYQREPKLRDMFLQIMFDHANTGGFKGSFTDAANLVILRENLLDAARTVLADRVSDVLITDIVRQDS